MGASFCHVKRIIPVSSGIPCVTSGTQKWKGARPNLIARAKVIAMEAQLSESCIKVHWFVDQAL